MTIHHEHPFAAGLGARNPLRRFRGRMPSPVSVWTTESGGRRAGWTLSSFLVADGEPAEVLGLVDEDSDLADLLLESAPGRTAAEAGPGPTRLVVNLVGPQHRGLADAFAGVAPAPGGPFRLSTWLASDWGPVLADSPGWLGARLLPGLDHAGWGLLVRAVVEHVEIGADEDAGALAYVRGRYRGID